jgi:hypothetical protein
MSIKNPSALKLMFLPGSIPTSADFSTLINSGTNTDRTQAFYTAIRDATGFVKVEPNYNFSIKGGSILKQLLKVETTASATSIFNVIDEIKVSADFAIQGTAQVTATGNLNSGITIGLSGTETARWIKGGNRVNVTDRGKLTSINTDYGDYLYTFHRETIATTGITVIHPDFASARSVEIFCSSLSHNGQGGTGQLQFRLVKSTSQTINDTYNTYLYYDFGTGQTNTEHSYIFVQNSIEATAGSAFNLLATINPIPRAKGAYIEGSINKKGTTSRSGFFTTDIVSSATVKGFRVGFSNGNKFNPGGIIRVGIK